MQPLSETVGGPSKRLSLNSALKTAHDKRLIDSIAFGTSLTVGENSVISMKRIRKRLGISGRDGKLTKLIRPRGKR